MCRSIKTLRTGAVPASEEEIRAAALQFVMGHPSVASVIPGARSAVHVERNVESFRHPIPAEFFGQP